MKVVIDANVWVAAVKSNEAKHKLSLAFLQQIQSLRASVVCPNIVIAECAAAIKRSTGNTDRADELVGHIERFPKFRKKAITNEVVANAVEVIRKCGLRGYDAIYVAIASLEDEELVTYDQELLNQNVLALVEVMTPDEWITKH